MEPGISDVGVPRFVEAQAVRHVEQAFAERSDDVTGVRIQDQDCVLVNHLSIREGPIRLEGATAKNITVFTKKQKLVWYLEKSLKNVKTKNISDL
jgi:hypothetical protein